MKKLGFGMMRLPINGDDYSNINKEASKKMIDKYIQEGFCYFDTAYFYHKGNSEPTFGELVASRYPRDSFVVTTKMPIFNLNTIEEYEKTFNDQLNKCNVDYFDNYFLHCITADNIDKVEQLNGFDFLVKKKREGKIKTIGFSFHATAKLLDEILTRHPEVELVQLQINYLDWESEAIQSRLCYEVARKHNKKIAIMEPVKGGALVNIPQKAIDLLKSYNPDASVASWAIRYAASLEGVIIVLSGMSNMEQVEDNISYMKDFKPLNEEELILIEKVVNIINESAIISCTNCKYCIEGCPKKISIPDYFVLYNKSCQFGMMGNIVGSFKKLAEENGKPSDCIGCKQCERKCPQHLPIVEYLKLVEGAFEK